ncbi:MAG TPA: 3' terminal RNA ribose 2'-O-methyltransferase Hen1 [Ktedonobacteraceae bacterium]|nr:3' terminal RNA ribose 2'-O-methyltransferase Hen1 [Ktedonobacteraceae bacterium]
MLLTITTTYQPATDLGYLLHKNPARVQSFALSFGKAHVFYPEVSDECCTAALLLDVDPVQLVCGSHGAASLEQYVNDRPYVASSFLSVAIAQVYGTALNGHSAARQGLAEMDIPLRAKIAVLPCRGGEGLLKRLFEPLGYTVTAMPHMLDEIYPEWGMSIYYTVTLEASCRLRDLLTHLYVLVPVLDDDKHYWIGDDEVEKLLRRGKGWLETHPEREQIAYRYLKHKRSLARDAIARLTAEDAPDEDTAEKFARPATVIITTPNSEYNVKFETLPTGQFRHKDHRFEWTRQEFQAWANTVAERFNYSVRFLPVGSEDSLVGAPSQMAIFSREIVN